MHDESHTPSLAHLLHIPSNIRAQQSCKRNKKTRARSFNNGIKLCRGLCFRVCASNKGGTKKKCLISLWGGLVAAGGRRDLRSVSPPDEARLLGFGLLAEMLRCTLLCEGLWTAPAATWPPAPAEPTCGGMLRSDSELPDLEPSLSGCNTSQVRYCCCPGFGEILNAQGRREPLQGDVGEPSRCRCQLYDDFCTLVALVKALLLKLIPRIFQQCTR